MVIKNEKEEIKDEEEMGEVDKRKKDMEEDKDVETGVKRRRQKMKVKRG